MGGRRLNPESRFMKGGGGKTGGVIFVRITPLAIFDVFLPEIVAIYR